MRRRRLPLGVVVPMALVVLVGTLATLQYRWLGQVSEAERAQLSRSLEQRAHELANDFDRELGRAYLTFQINRAEPESPDLAELAQRLALWQTESLYPSMVRAIYLTTIDDGGERLLRFDAERLALDPIDWPEQLEPVRERLTARRGGGSAASTRTGETQFMAILPVPLVADVPALVIPVLPPAGVLRQDGLATARTTPPGPAGERDESVREHTLDVLRTMRFGRDALIVELDAAYMAQVMLPALVDRHFVERDAGSYRISVVDAGGRPLLTRGLAEGVTLAPDAADVSARFFTLRLDLARAAMGERQMVTWALETRAAAERIEGGRGPAGAVAIRVERALTDGEVHLKALATPVGWRLFVQHAAGSLDAAVAQARRRNLWLSFGILSVLGVSVGLIVLNASRSERLAGQQMDFVATVSHELRTPLAVIRSAAQNLSAGVVHDAAQARRYGDLIEHEGRRLTDMVEQVLEYAGLAGNRRPPRAHPVELGPVIREAVEACRALSDDQGMEIVVDIAPDLPAVAADAEALRRALQNLVSNALKYAADGRWMGVTARAATERGRDELQIAVSDKGRGIDADDLAHVFEPFYRGRYALERQIQGNGLGLSLVRRIAEAHGGRVTVKSARGEGTTFTIHLPAAPAERAPQPVGAPAADTGRHPA